MIIDQCYEGVIGILTAQNKIKDVSKKLLTLTTNAERVLYVFELLCQLKAFPSIKEVKKSDSVSTYYRNQGNTCFQACADYKAWQFYNMSLLHAPEKSDNYKLAIANRSAVFFSMKKYKECLKDIDKVLGMKCVQKLQDKLLKRQKLCEEALCENKEGCDDNSSDLSILVVQGPKDPRYLCASTKLQVTFSEEMGRLVVAKEDIKVGEILVEEYPYFTIVLKSQYLFSCSYCLSRSLNLWPCKNCCYTFYCSGECRDRALKEYHETECQLLATLYDMDFTKLELLALRLVIKARCDHDNWESLLKTIEEAESNMNNEFRGHVLVDGNWIYDSKYYTSIHTLETNLQKRSVSDIFQKAVTAAVFLKYLEDNTNFMKIEDSTQLEKIKKFIAGTLLLHLMTSPTNMHGISSYIESTDGTFIESLSLASAPYAFHSLLNHSCAPNVVRFNILGSGKMLLLALRPIKKGMQIFDNYGAHYAIEGRSERQASLKFQYKFSCLCEACVNNWPTYLSMGQSTNIPKKLQNIKENLLDSGTICELQKGNKATAIKLFKSLCSLCEHFEPYAPCVELCDCQESLKQCASILCGLVPYGYSLLIPWSAIPPEVSLTACQD